MEPRGQFEIRRMMRTDLEEVLAIEKISFPAPWSRVLFEQEFQFPHAHLLAAAEPAFPERVRGYLCFWLVAEETHILNLAVHPDGKTIRAVVERARPEPLGLGESDELAHGAEVTIANDATAGLAAITKDITEFDLALVEGGPIVTVRVTEIVLQDHGAWTVRVWK